jgi:hypothetical protein
MVGFSTWFKPTISKPKNPTDNAWIPPHCHPAFFRIVCGEMSHYYKEMEK